MTKNSLVTRTTEQKVFVVIPPGWPFESHRALEAYTTKEDAKTVRNFNPFPLDRGSIVEVELREVVKEDE